MILENQNHITQSCPTISVVIPVYNTEEYIERCVTSVMRQNFPATECIIVDDASTDDSIDICERLIQDYCGTTSFFIIHHDFNKGLSAARNTGTNIATSDYIFYLDSDDEILPFCLEKLIEPVIHDDTIEMVMGEHITSYKAVSGIKNGFKGNITNFLKHTPLEIHTNEDVRKWYYSKKTPKIDYVWNKLLRLSFVKTNNLYNKEGILFEDLLWSYYLNRCLSHVAFVHETTYIQHRRAGSITTGITKEEKLSNYGFILQEIAENIVTGERIEETERWLPDFLLCYVDASKKPEYIYIFNAFLNHLSDGRHRLSVLNIKTAHFFSKFRVGRYLYKFMILSSLRVRKVAGI